MHSSAPPPMHLGTREEDGWRKSSPVLLVFQTACRDASTSCVLVVSTANSELFMLLRSERPKWNNKCFTLWNIFHLIMKTLKNSASFLFFLSFCFCFSRQGPLYVALAVLVLASYPRLPQTHRDPPASASWVLGLKACAATWWCLISSKYQPSSLDLRCHRTVGSWCSAFVRRKQWANELKRDTHCFRKQLQIFESLTSFIYP